MTDIFKFVGVWEFVGTSACGILDFGGATHAAELLSEVPDTKRYTDQHVWVLDVRLISSPRINSIVSKSRQHGCHSPKMGRNAME
jgi:hypothetical protein